MCKAQTKIVQALQQHQNSQMGPKKLKKKKNTLKSKCLKQKLFQHENYHNPTPTATTTHQKKLGETQ